MSSRSLDDLRPTFRLLANAWLQACQAASLDILVYCTLRSMQEQDELYAHGRTAPGAIVTNARAGQSAHNFGLALDFVPLLNGKPQWSAGNGLYVMAIQLATARGLQSLSHSSFPEWAHLQHPDWVTLSTEIDA